MSLASSHAPCIGPDVLDQLYPFGLAVDARGNCTWLGRTLHKLIPTATLGSPFRNFLQLLSPEEIGSPLSLDALAADVIILKVIGNQRTIRLRGQCIDYGQGSYLFALTPVVTDFEKISELHLDFSDFSLSDPIFDLLLLIQTERRSISELKRAMEREQKHIAQIANASRLASLGEMSAGIAHEINNPLSIMLMGCEQLLEIPAMQSERATTVLKRAHNAGLRIAKIVHSLRTYARDGTLGEIVPTNAAQLVADTLEICRARFRDKDIDLQIADIPEDLEFDCNAVQVSQVLMNLLVNAFDGVQSLPERWVRLDVSADSRHVTFRVTDSGPPIPDEIADRIMQPFFTTKPPGKGTGLGLPISLGIAEAHGGRFELDRTQPHPSFVLELPRTRKT